MDLFEDYELIPEELKTVCDKWQQRQCTKVLTIMIVPFFRKNAKPSAIRLITGWMQMYDLRAIDTEEQKLEKHTINNQKIWN